VEQRAKATDSHVSTGNASQSSNREAGMNAGGYGDRMTWKKRTTVKNALGEDEEVFADNGFLWSAIDLGSGRNNTDYGAEQTGADAIIRVRNWPGLSALDRLYSAEWDELWIIDNIVRGDNELVCNCVKYDALQL
jgi:head-tail adaptor